MEIHGTSRTDLNGKRGVATDFHMVDFEDPTTWRYTVKLDGSEAFKLKVVNVRAEGAGGGGGGGGAGTYMSCSGVHVRTRARVLSLLYCVWWTRRVLYCVWWTRRVLCMGYTTKHSVRKKTKHNKVQGKRRDKVTLNERPDKTQ